MSFEDWQKQNVAVAESGGGFEAWQAENAQTPSVDIESRQQAILESFPDLYDAPPTVAQQRQRDAQADKLAQTGLIGQGEAGLLVREAYKGPGADAAIKREMDRRRYKGFTDELNKGLERGGERLGSGVLGSVASGMRFLGRSPVLYPLTRYGPLEKQAGQVEAASRPVEEAAQAMYEDAQRWSVQPGRGGGLPGFVASTMGETLPLMAASTVAMAGTGMAGAWMISAMSEGDNAYREAIANGASPEQAETTRIIVGSVNGAIELAQVGSILRLGKTASKEVAQQFAKEVSESALKKIAASGGAISAKMVRNSINEGLEEVAQEWVGEGTAVLVYDKEFDAQNMAARTWQSFAGGATAGFFLGAGSLVLQGALTQATTPIPQTQPAAQRPEIAAQRPEIGTQGTGYTPTVQPPKPSMAMTEAEYAEYEATLPEPVEEEAAPAPQPAAAVPPEGQAAGVAKQPWEMTRDEYKKSYEGEVDITQDAETQALEQDIISKYPTEENKMRAGTGRFTDTKPVILYRGISQQELDDITSTGKVVGGKYSTPAEQALGAQWSATPEEATRAAFHDQKTKGVLGQQKYLIAVDASGKIFFGLETKRHTKDTPGRYPLKDISGGIGVSIPVEFDEVLLIERVGTPETGQRRATWGKIVDASPDIAYDALTNMYGTPTAGAAAEGQTAGVETQPTAPSPAPIVPAIKPGQAGPVSLEQKAAEQSPGASAGTAPGFPATESAGRIKVAMGPKGKPISAREIIDFAKRAFNVTMRGVATHRKRALGWYDPHAVGIRLKDVRSITTAIHEVGHYLDWHTNDRWSKKPGSKAIADELMAMGKALYGDTKPPGGYKSEGWAEFTREYLTGEDAESIAPNLHKWFTETYLAKNPEMAKNLNAIKGMIENWRFQGAEARVESQINRKPIKGTIRERLSHLSLWADTMFRDELAPLRVRLKEAGVEGLSPSQDPVELSVAYADKAGAKARHFVMEYTTDLAGNRTGEGLKQVLGPVRKEMKPFTRWIIAKRALWLHKRGINPGISQADAQFVYDKYKSEAWEKVATNITEWNHRLLDYLHDSGAMDSESLKKIKELNPIYVPFMRAFAEGEAQRQGDGGKGIAKVGKPVKAIKGSGREIIDPFESMIQQAERIFSTAHKSMVARSLAKIAERPGMAAVMWKVPAPTQAVQFSAEQLKKDIVRIAQSRLGLDPDVISSGMMDEWDEVLTVYYNASQYYGKDNIVSLVIDGNRQFYEVDPDVYRVMEGLDQYSLPWFMSVFGKAARTVRLGATGLNASFGLVRNFIRDSMTFSVLAKHAKLGPVSAAAGVVKDIARTEPAQKFKAMGGKMAVQVLQDRKATQNLRGEVVESIVVRTVLHPIDALRELFGITEAGVRIAEFEAALKAGEDIYGTGSLDAAVYALNQAQDVTTNFTRHGRIAKVLNQMIPFFNAALQGPDKIVRTFRERPVATAIKAIAGLTVPALLMWWWNKDEDWYKALDASEKARYLHFRVPGTAHIMRIPIPFELGHIFQSIPIAALDARYNNDPGEVRRAFEEAVRDANPTDWPALVGPVVDVMQNKDWADRPIVTESMSRKLPEDQYKPWTTELMREIGATLDASPAQLEYLVNSYSGGLYGRVARTFEMGVNRKEQPSDWPVVGTLFMRDAYRPNRKIAEFYDAMEQLSQKDASDKATIEEQSQLRVYRSISRKMSPYWTALREDDVPDERKKELYAGLEQLLDLASEYAKKQ